MDAEPGVVEPARRLGEAEGLAPQLVRADQDDIGHVTGKRIDGTEAFMMSDGQTGSNRALFGR